jgi:hypothetical protein
MKCPICQYEDDFEFQTKEFVQLLLHFHVGDNVNKKIKFMGPGQIYIKDGEILGAISSCKNCKSRLRGNIVIKDGVFTGVKNVKRWDDPEDVGVNII